MVKKVSNEELARMIARGFENTATKQDMGIVKADLNIIKNLLAGIKLGIESGK